MRLSYRWQATIVITIGLFMAVLDNTIVSVALPQIQKNFGTTFESVTWVATGYFLAQAAIIPIVGYLSDRVGTKIVYLAALGLFIIGSALCIVAGSVEQLIIFRLVQGLGGGALMPIAFAIIFRLFTPTERGPITSIIGIPVLLAPAFGPTIGGYLTTTFDWRAIFAINLPIGLVACLLAVLVLPHRAREQEQDGTASSNEQRRKRFDIAGLVLSMTGFTALVYGINEAGTLGWDSPTVLGFIVAGILILITFIIVELRVNDPVLDLRLFRYYTFSIANVMTWVISAVLFGSLFLLPFFFENVRHNTPFETGLWLIPQGLGTAAGMTLAGRLYNNVGPRPLAVIGLIIMSVGTFGLTQLQVSTAGTDLTIWLALRGFGLGLTNAPLQTLALSVVSNQAMARASSLVNVTRMVFSSIGVAALTTLLTQRSKFHGEDFTQTTAGQDIIANCTAAAGADTQALQECIAQHATTLGLNDTFWFVLISSIVCLVFALLLGRDPAIEAARRARSEGKPVEDLPKVPIAIE